MKIRKRHRDIADAMRSGKRLTHKYGACRATLHDDSGCECVHIKTVQEMLGNEIIRKNGREYFLTDAWRNPLDWEMRPMLGYPDYFVDNCGQFYSKNKRRKNGRLRPLSMQWHRRRYWHTNISIDGVAIVLSSHSQVLRAFIGERPPEMECRHKDGNPKNSRLDNLSWGTRKENQADAFLHGGRKMGEEHAQSVFTNDSILLALCLRHLCGLDVPTIGRIIGRPSHSIYRVLHGGSWNHLTGYQRT